jgi:hypothetical protein
LVSICTSTFDAANPEKTRVIKTAKTTILKDAITKVVSISVCLRGICFSRVASFGGTGNGERGGLGREMGGRRLKFEGRMMNLDQRAVPDG